MLIRDRYLFNNYKIQINNSSVKCISVNGRPTLKFVAPDTSKNLAKLYVVKNGHEIYYVGITIQSISSRLRYGFTAKGENGYHGYKWKNLAIAELLVWSFPDMNSQQVEAIEAELVYFVREKTGKWPTYQMEIHFHGASESERHIAKSILEDCLQEAD